MSERFRALLDTAVSDLEPADPDPVPAIIGRARRARRRAVGAGALAMVLLAGLAAAAGVRVTERTGAVTSTVAAQPPVPRVVGRTVVAGDVVVPIPDGWRVVIGSKRAPCTELKKTILIYVIDGDHCQTAPVEVGGTIDVNPPGLVSFNGRTAFALPPSPYTLRGGAPAWLIEPTSATGNDPHGKAAGYHFRNSMIVPWSKVKVEMSVPGPEQQRILDSISVTPAPRAGRLVLPPTAVEAELSRSGTQAHGSLTGTRRIDAVLRLLRAQHKTVDGGHACAGPDLPAARLTLRSAQSWPSAASAEPNLAPAPITTVIITLGGCREAVSSNGGRVRLSQHTVDALERLFGITR